jgi:Heavy-metal resistance
VILVLVYGLGAGPSPAGPPDREVESGSAMLNLTDDQAQAFQELRTRFGQEMIQVRKKMASKRLELRTLSEEEFHGPRGEEIRRDLQALFLEGRERALVYQAEALKILRAEQKEKLPPGSDLGFRCQWGGVMGGGPGRGFHRNRKHPELPAENPPGQP